MDLKGGGGVRATTLCFAGGRAYGARAERARAKWALPFAGRGGARAARPARARSAQRAREFCTRAPPEAILLPAKPYDW